MKKEAFDFIKKELKYLGISLMFLFLALETAFFRENLLIVIRNSLALFWVFALPGYFVMLYWRKNLEFAERLLIGAGVAAGITGILAYYIGLIGLNIKYLTLVLPLTLILVGAWISLRD